MCCHGHNINDFKKYQVEKVTVLRIILLMVYRTFILISQLFQVLILNFLICKTNYGLYGYLIID